MSDRLVLVTCVVSWASSSISPLCVFSVFCSRLYVSCFIHRVVPELYFAPLGWHFVFSVCVATLCFWHLAILGLGLVWSFGVSYSWTKACVCRDNKVYNKIDLWNQKYVISDNIALWYDDINTHDIKSYLFKEKFEHIKYSCEGMRLMICWSLQIKTL